MFDVDVVIFPSAWQMQTSLFVQQHLLKSGKSIRQFYENAADAEIKVRE